MTHLLDDPVQKVLRARKHAQELKEPLRAFRSAYAESFGDHVDARTGEKRWVMLADPPPVPIEISMILGEAIYQYRSALDHLVWQLVIANEQTPDKHNAFPVCDVSKWSDSLTQRRVRGLHPNAQALIKDQLPGNGRHRNRENWLLWLDDLWNVDKHRHIYLATNASGGGFFDPPLPIQAPNEVFIHDGAIERGTVLASVPAKYAGVNFLFRPSITLGQGVACAGSHVEMLTHEMDALVSGIIGLARPFFAPDGPPLPPFVG